MTQDGRYTLIPAAVEAVSRRLNFASDIQKAADDHSHPREQARSVLDRLAQPEAGFLERKGRTKAATYHLTKGAAKELLGKAAYTKTRGLDPIRYAEMVKAFVADHGSITPRECRELLGLGESDSARVEASKYLRLWSAETGFLQRLGTRGPKVRYTFRQGEEEY
jgi:ATP-dependent DNA helicase RecG